MAVNNEIGVIQPLQEIGELCRSHKVFFHTDAAQAVGKIDIDVNKMKIDLLSISGHKIYGPKGYWLYTTVYIVVSDYFAVYKRNKIVFCLVIPTVVGTHGYYTLFLPHLCLPCNGR